MLGVSFWLPIQSVNSYSYAHDSSEPEIMPLKLPELSDIITLLFLYASLAQMVEQLIRNE